MTELMVHFHASDQVHLALELVQVALHIVIAGVIARIDGIVKVTLPLTLEVEGGTQLVGNQFGIDAVVEEGHVYIQAVLLVVDRIGELEQDVAVVAFVAFGPH